MDRDNLTQAPPFPGYTSQPAPQPPYVAPTPPDAYSRTGLPSHSSSNWKPYAIGALITALILIIGYQQYQLSTLKRDVGIISNDMRTSDVPQRLDAIDKKLDEVNQRITYEDSKINAVDQKAQTSLDKWRAEENKGNIFTDFIRNVGRSLGIK